MRGGPPARPARPDPEPIRRGHPPALGEILRRWGWIGCTGFGGPPAHIALLRELCVGRRRWMSDEQFARALAAANMLPGPASTQLAIYCAWRLRGWRGALVGGAAFIAPGLIAIIALAAAFLSGSPPAWLRGAGAGAGAAVPAVAVCAGLVVARPIWAGARGAARSRALAYALAGALAAALTGPWLVLVLIACGLTELARRRRARGAGPARLHGLSPLALVPGRAARAIAAAAAPAGVLPLVWTAFKVGALAFGGGFVIVPLMQADAVSTYHWMSHAQFLEAVVLGQVTPGPVTHTVAAVGYAAGGVPGALLAALVAFAPSFAIVLAGAARFRTLLADERVRCFVGGAAPCAAGAIIGAAIPLAAALGEQWQAALLAAAAIALLVLRRGIVMTLVLAGGAGALLALLGAPVPR